MTSKSHSDEDIILKIKRGTSKDEHEVVAFLMQSYRGLVHSIVLRPGLGSSEDAQDILNDAISDLLNQVRSETFELHNTRLSTFFYALAKNRWLNVLRKRSRQLIFTNVEESELNNGKESEEALTGLIADEQKNAVHKALRKLENPCFTILYNYWIKDMKLRDIAVELGVTEEAVKKRHERCRKKLKALLRQDPRKH